MSKYSEALNDFIVWKDDNEKNLNIIQEAIAKAEKYDEVKQQKEHYKAMVEKAVKENPLREPYDELLQENKKLKEGIKAITKHYDISFNPFQIAFNQIYFGGIPREDTDKIKSMLEVVENDR